MTQRKGRTSSNGHGEAVAGAGVPAERVGILGDVRLGLSHLRGIESLPKLLDKAAQELVETVGFSRAIVSRVFDASLLAESIYFDGRPEEAEQVLTYWRSHPPELTHELLETELLRRRHAAIVGDAQANPRTYKPLIELTETMSYVAAPVAPEGRVIGFLHADHLYTGKTVDEVDRDALWTFAEGLGYAVERTVMLDRLRGQRTQIRQMVVSIEALTSDLVAADVEMVVRGAESLDVAHTAASMFVAPESRIAALLTPRELEVLGLMAEGATNGAIANRLVISEGTVKSHVKHILRKLRAANRAEAVSRYMRLMSPRPGGA
jgi:DNA-binding CsgD family transcriptional regulator